jgi:hypothetical protein
MKDRLYALALDVCALALDVVAWTCDAIAWAIEEIVIPLFEFLRWLAFKLGF